jgi:formylglycine-generating enzyme required for sulfatase activity
VGGLVVASAFGCEVVAGLGDDRHLVSDAGGDVTTDAPVSEGGGDGGTDAPVDTGSDVVVIDGGCGAPTSCATRGPGRGTDCGGTHDCCEAIPLAGGKFFRFNDITLPATVSPFCLDRFEITVGRMRVFVDAGFGTAAKPPAVGSGAHPKVPGSGWDANWNGKLATTTADLQARLACDALSPWTDAAGANERFPALCLDWYTAFAFCVWDGGRLATDAEYNYAAAGFDEQRVYPWGPDAPDPAHAVYDCNQAGDAGDCTAGDLLPVGSRSPLGDGRFGHADLAGSANEWVLDTDIAMPVPCNDCATITPAGEVRVKRGEGFTNDTFLATTSRDHDPPDLVHVSQGVRCVR